MVDASEPQYNVSVTGHPKNRLYINGGASVHILFNWELLGDLIQLNWIINIQTADKPRHLTQIRSLNKALRHQPLPVNDYHYSDNEIANLLLFSKLAGEYYIIYNTRVNDTIYVQSKDDRKYL